MIFRFYYISYCLILAILLGIKPCYCFNQVYDSVRIELEYEVKNVYGLNTEYAEFSPVWYNTDLIFSSDREWDYNNFGETNWSKNKKINLFKVQVKSYKEDSVVFKKPELYNNLLVGNDHVGPIDFFGKNEAVISQVDFRKSKKKANPQLYLLSIEGRRIKKKEKFEFSDPNFSYSQPTFSADGQKIYFVSNQPCEKNGTNIFVTSKIEGIWSEPELVSNICSDYNEMFPVIEGSKLYFSSNRAGGYGGLDLYECELKNGLCSDPVNLGETINTASDEFGMVFNPNGKSGYFSSNRDAAVGGDDIFSFNRIERVIVVSQYSKIEGQFDYKLLEGNPNRMEVLLLDEEGNIVSKTTTDENGKFIFNYLPVDNNYKIKVNQDGDVVLTLFNEDGKAILLANEKGEFVFRELSHSGSSFMSLIDENDIDLSTGKVDFKGQFRYQKLSTNKPSSMKVFLVDEDGNIIMETETDEFGNFVFKDLPTDKNYIVKVDDQNDMVLMVFNNVDHLVAMMTKGSKGTFIYRMLDTDNNVSIDLITEQEGELVFRKERMMVSGQFVFENLDGNSTKIDFDILDNEGHLLMHAETDEEFKFRFENLPLLEDLLFKIDENSPFFNADVKLKILNRMNETLIQLEKDELGMFSYKRIVSSKYNTTEVDQLENNEIVKEERSFQISNYVIYYPNNGVLIDAKYTAVLDSMVLSLNDDKNATIQVHGHASSLASEDYNMKLSLKRMQKVVDYLTGKGISNDRILKNAFGESQLVNFCEDDKNCEDEMHRLNRRTELKIITED